MFHGALFIPGLTSAASPVAVTPRETRYVTTPGVIGIRLGPMLCSEGHGQIHWAWILPRSEDQVLNGNHRKTIGKP